MFDSILVVCVGNICRSPVGERLLARRLTDAGSTVSVASAGIAALVGQAADEDAAAVAAAHGISLDGHVARQFTHDIGKAHALVLVMEAGHKREIVRTAPDLAGRIMLFDHWTGGQRDCRPLPPFHHVSRKGVRADRCGWHRVGAEAGKIA